MSHENGETLGLMKDENNGAIMTEFVGFRAKICAYKVAGRGDTKRNKGVKKSAVSHEISFNNYVECLVEAKERSKRQSTVRSVLHNVSTMSELKIALSSHDDKRTFHRDCMTLCRGDTTMCLLYKKK